MRIQVVFARVLLVLMGLFGFIINQVPQEQIESFLRAIPYRCPLRLITGLKCAFCGMTHSWIALFKGDFQGSFQENVFGLPLFLISMFFLIAVAAGKKITPQWKPALTLGVLILVSYAVIRNIISM